MGFAFRRKRAILVLLLLLLIALAIWPLALRGWGAYQCRVARQALEQRDFRQADQRLKRCLKIRPEDSDVHLLAAQAARRQQNYPRAFEHLRICRQMGGSATALALEHQLLSVQQGDLTEFDALLARCAARRNEPETPLILEALIEGSLKVLGFASSLGLTVEGGPAFPDLQRTYKAVELWLEVRASRVDRAQGLVWRSRLCGFRNDHAGARANLEKAMALTPDDFEARKCLALAIVQKAPQEAVEHLRTLLQRHPDDRFVLFSLASSLHGLGQLEEARRLLDAMLSTNPNDVSALMERGNIAVDTEQYGDAERWLRRAVELAPAKSQCHFCLASCLRLVGKKEEAEYHQNQFKLLEEEHKRAREIAIREFEAQTKRKGQLQQREMPTNRLQ